MEHEPRNRLLGAALAGADPSEIATGKAYQLLWNLVGLAKLHRATSNVRYLDAVRAIWEKVRAHHLTLGGGPWGGVAHRSREVFNPAGVFSPEGYVETCSTMAWVQLNRELLVILGDAAYAQEIERSAYNDLIGAQSPNGEDWCYYSFPNGRRLDTTYWRCCKSSGSMALEELPAIAYGVTANGALAVNLLGPSEATLELPGTGLVRVRQETRYPLDGRIVIVVEPAASMRFPVHVRIPDWADGATLRVGDEAFSAPAGGYAPLVRDWRWGDVIELDLPMRTRVHTAASRNVQESLAPGGIPVAQEVMRFDYIAVSHGPLAYATGLIDGFKRSETLRFEGAPIASMDGDLIRLQPAGRAPIVFEPYYRLGAGQDGSWRLTWLGLADAEGGG